MYYVSLTYPGIYRKELSSYIIHYSNRFFPFGTGKERNWADLFYCEASEVNHDVSLTIR